MAMNPTKRMWATIALTLLAVAGLALCLLQMTTRPDYAEIASRCIHNLKNLQIGVEKYCDEHGSYPSSLQAITNYCTNRNWFVCPATRHKPGPMSDLLQWTDYGWVPRTIDDLTNGNLPAIYCVPDHHHHSYGFVALIDGSVMSVGSNVF
jgi:hypothetical protein